MELLSRLRGLVVTSPLRPPTCRHGRSTRSMVDGLIRQSCASVEASTRNSLCCLSTFTISGMNGCNRLEHTRSLASQTAFSASATPVPYLRGRPRHLTALEWLGRFNNLIAALRCKPVTLVNSSSILPFSPLDAPKYRLLNACAYSIMLRRVTFTSFGNTNFDATTPLSVTFIINQCGLLTAV
jgi:hypothetical protein